MQNRHLKHSIYMMAISYFAMATSCSDSNHGHESGQHPDESNIEKAEHHDHAGLIELDNHHASEYGIATEKIEPSEFAEVLLVSGRIESKASDESVAAATKSGIVTLYPDINVGVKVGAGSPIGSISTSSVQGADPTVEAIAALEAAKRELDRLTPLHKDGIVSTQTYNNALASFEQAQAALRSSKQGSATISSPKSGVITQLLVKSGEYVESGQKIAVVSGNTHLTLRADIPEKYAMRLPGIESANFRPASSEETFSIKDLNGRIITNPTSAVAENGYIPLYFSFDNNGGIAPGAFAEVYLQSGLRHGVLSVPKEAIVEINGNKCIYSRHDGGHYVKHVVVTGASDGQRMEIVSGLEPGKDVVVKGSQIVRMAETSATAVPGHTHNH